MMLALKSIVDGVVEQFELYKRVEKSPSLSLALLQEIKAVSEEERADDEACTDIFEAVLERTRN